MNCKLKGCEEIVYCCKLCKTHYKQEIHNNKLWIIDKKRPLEILRNEVVE